jgi:hypothetical protein
MPYAFLNSFEQSIDFKFLLHLFTFLFFFSNIQSVTVEKNQTRNERGKKKKKRGAFTLSIYLDIMHPTKGDRHARAENYHLFFDCYVRENDNS